MMFYKSTLLSKSSEADVGRCKSFANFTGKHLEVLFNKSTGRRSVTLLERDSNWCFPMKFAKYLRIQNTF